MVLINVDKPPELDVSKTDTVKAEATAKEKQQEEKLKNAEELIQKLRMELQVAKEEAAQEKTNNILHLFLILPPILFLL
jgi:hypothetical protein